MAAIELNSLNLLADASLVAYYRLESDGSDSKGSNTLTASGSGTHGTAKFGNGFSTGNSHSHNNYLTRSDGLGVDLSGEFCMGGWIKINTALSNSTGYTYLDWRSTTGTARYNLLQYRKDGSGNSFLRVDNASGTPVDYTVDLGTTDWHLVLAQKQSDGKLHLYLDGREVGTAQTQGTGSAGNLTSIGRGGTNDGLACTQDDVFFFSRSLTAAEIRGLYLGFEAKELDNSLNSTLRNDANLVAYYKGENANDSTANGYNLTNVGSATFTTGKFTNAFNLGTSNNSKYLHHSSAMGIGTSTARTMACWVKLTTEVSSGEYTFLNHANINANGDRFRIYYQYNGGTRRIIGSRDGASGTLYAIYNITMGTTQWYHLAATYDGSAGGTLYINGVAVATYTSTGTTSIGGTLAFAVGADNAAGSMASALIDDVAVFSRTLTSAEVQKLAQGFKPKEISSSTLTSSLTHNWRLEGNSNDAVGSLNGTDTSITYGSPYGIFTQGASFNGSSSRIVTGNEAFVDTITWNAWVRHTANAEKVGILLHGNPNTTVCKYLAISSDGTLYFSDNPASGQTKAWSSVSAVGLNEWHMVTVTQTDINTVAFYIDGVSAGVGSPSGSAVSLPSGTAGGYYIGSSGDYYFNNGYIDDVAVWNTVLTAAQIATIYNTTSNAYSLTAAQGSYALTGYASLFHLGLRLVAAAASYTLSVFDAAFSRGKGLFAATGEFALTGIAAALTSVRTMTTSQGNFTLTGQDATFRRAVNATLTAAHAVYTVTGSAARFLFNGLTMVWTNATKHSASWTNKTKN